MSDTVWVGLIGAGSTIVVAGVGAWVILFQMKRNHAAQLALLDRAPRFVTTVPTPWAAAFARAEMVTFSLPCKTR